MIKSLKQERSERPTQPMVVLHPYLLTAAVLDAQAPTAGNLAALGAVDSIVRMLAGPRDPREDERSAKDAQRDLAWVQSAVHQLADDELIEASIDLWLHADELVHCSATDKVCPCRARKAERQVAA